MDPLLITIHVLLAALGILGVATGSPEAGLDHAARVAACFVITWAVSRLSPHTIVRVSPYLYAGVLALLALVLLIGTSPSGSDSKRWLLVAGFSLQPSEMMKITVIAYLTAFFHNHLGNWQIWRPMVVMGLAAGLIVAEPDVSTALFIFVLAFAIMLAAGTTITRLLSISSAAAMIALLVAGPYLSQFVYLGERLTSLVDMWGGQTERFGISYQAYQAQQTLIKAGFFGIGPGLPMRVPEAETDMVAIAISQALGLVGIATLVILFVMLAGRGMRIAASIEGPGSLLAAGATAYICGQAALNLLVASGMFPITGIPLPFVSYGLNSLVSVSIAMGFIHGAYRRARLEGVRL